MASPSPLPGQRLVAFVDPMCSWCYGFQPSLAAAVARFGAALPVELVMGGLRPGTRTPMDPGMAASIRGHWQHVAEASGQPFDFAFFDRANFVYDTEPAARAVVTVRALDPQRALTFFERVQQAFYAENRDVTDPATLADLAADESIERSQFAERFASAEMVDETASDFLVARRVGATGFPTVIAGRDNGDWALITEGFRPPREFVARIESWLNA